jgi:hypothetical protein
MPKNNIKCYIYTRVSTAIQVDGYSLDAIKREDGQQILFVQINADLDEKAYWRNY